MATKIDVATNILVPKHEKINAKETEQLLKKYDLASTDNLPKILKKDPAIAELKAIEGEVIKITRDSSTTGTSIFYRVVISD